MTDHNPYTPPKADLRSEFSLNSPDVEYAGFWVRVLASAIDSVLLILVTFPLLIAIYGTSYFSPDASTGLVAGVADILISWVFPVVAVVWFWTRKQATPGKMALSLRVLDAVTGQTLSIGQSLGRYLGYIVSTIPLGLGLLWVGFDKRKQGWHDKLAGTVVVRVAKR